MSDAPLPGVLRRYHLCQAIHLLEARSLEEAGAQGQLGQVRRLGQACRADQERVRLRPSLSLAFPISDVETLDIVGADERLGRPQRYLLTANLFGIYGATSPLPLWYGQRILSLSGKQPQVRAFLDIFHHRLFTFYYLAWKRSRYECGVSDSNQDLLFRVLRDLVGLSFLGLPDKLPAERMVRYLGLFLLRNRPAAGLEVLLSSELHAWFSDERAAQVQVQPLPTPRWVPIPDEQIARLGHVRLQSGSLLGRSHLDRTGHLHLVVGPVSYRTLEQLAPGSRHHHRILVLMGLYIRQPLDVLIEVQVPQAEVPRPTLNGRVRMGGVVRSLLLGGHTEEGALLSFMFWAHAYRGQGEGA